MHSIFGGMALMLAPVAFFSAVLFSGTVLVESVRLWRLERKAKRDQLEPVTKLVLVQHPRSCECHRCERQRPQYSHPASWGSE